MTKGKLFITATPIGNLRDISAWALEVLQSADFIACEDTRHSQVLLNHYGIKKPLISCHKFNERERASKIIAKLKEGKNIAVISDAGMPVISDPGNLLINMCRDEGIEVTCISGATALINALVLSGMDARSFVFIGFLPKERGEAVKMLTPYTGLPCTLVFYCAPHSIDSDMRLLHEVLGDRSAAVVRELTKVHESVRHCRLSDGEKEARGEYVLVVEGFRGGSPLLELSIQEHIEHYISLGEDKKDAIKLVAKERNIAKSEVYKHTLKD